MKQLISSEEAEVAEFQHTKPCSDCPWRRDSLNGWLGGASIDEWLHTAHSDHYVQCHTKIGAQCVGIAIYRRNSCKRVEPPLLTMPADRDLIFGNRFEFTEHHSKLFKPDIKD